MSAKRETVLAEPGGNVPPSTKMYLDALDRSIKEVYCDKLVHQIVTQIVGLLRDRLVFETVERIMPQITKRVAKDMATEVVRHVGRMASEHVAAHLAAQVNVSVGRRIRAAMKRSARIQLLREERMEKLPALRVIGK